MNYASFVWFTIIVTIICMILIYKYAFFNGVPHCNHFVSNVYLYLALSLALTGCFIHLYNYLLNDKNERTKLLSNNQPFIQIGPYIMGSFIVAILSIIVLSTRSMFSKGGYMMNHMIWLIFISSISLTLYPYFKTSELSIVLQRALIMTCVLFLLMTSIVSIIPKLIKETYKKVIVGLFLALIAIIITELYLLFTNQYTNNLYTIISYVVIILFSIFIVYDTSRLYHYSSICVNSPNYPLVSTNLFLDILNIFVRLVGVSR